MPPKTQLDLYIEVDVLTSGTAAEVVNAILELLLYERNQIPFVYKTYRYYVNKWQQEEEKHLILNQECGVQSFQMQRKKDQAASKKEAISTMKQTIRNIFEKKSIKTLRFLFGSTTFTAKEAYTLHIPTDNIASNHFHEHHKISPGKLNQTLLSLLTNENLYAIFSHNLNPTNIYLEMELLENDNIELISCVDLGESLDIFPKDFLPLPTRCKDVHINLLHRQSSDSHYEHLKCCKLLKVFEDLSSLSIKCGREIEKDSSNDKNKILASLPAWWEAAVVVRGFKNQPTKGCNIWS